MKKNPSKSLHCASANDAQWYVTESYPQRLRQTLRWKTLIGGNGNDWVGSIPQKDVIVGVLDLDRGGYYPLHAHAAPEIYFILSGTADWTVEQDTFIAEPGMAIYHPSHKPHRMVNRGTEPLRTVWFWWAPDGRSELLSGEVTFSERSD